MRFRDAIAAEFANRRRRNPRYSLRSFAIRAGVHHSTMSRLLRASRPVPSRTVLHMGGRLGMDATEIAAFLAQEDASAVVEAIRRRGFRPDSRWLATVTGRSIDRVNVVLQRLLRIGVLRMSSRTRWEILEGVVE